MTRIRMQGSLGDVTFRQFHFDSRPHQSSEPKKKSLTDRILMALRGLVWVAGCVTARRRGLRSEHPGIAGAMRPSMSWDPWPRPVARTAVGTQECTQIRENDLSAPFRGTCVHCCAVADRRGYAGVYTDRRKWPLEAVLGHLCTLLRRELRRELRQVARVPQPPWCVGGASSVAASRMVGKTEFV